MDKIFVENNLILYLLVCITTTIFAFLIEKIKEVVKMKENNLLKDRAWIEIDLDNLVNNIGEIKKIISPKTKIMAVVKSKCLWTRGIINSKKIYRNWYN